MVNFGEFWVLVFPLGGTMYIYIYICEYTHRVVSRMLILILPCT